MYTKQITFMLLSICKNKQMSEMLYILAMQLFLWFTLSRTVLRKLFVLFASKIGFCHPGFVSFIERKTLYKNCYTISTDNSDYSKVSVITSLSKLEKSNLSTQLQIRKINFLYATSRNLFICFQHCTWYQHCVSKQLTVQRVFSWAFNIQKAYISACNRLTIFLSFWSCMDYNM